MEIQMVEGQYKSISARNWARLPKLALPIFGSRDSTLILGAFGEDATRRSRQSAWDQFITGTLQ